MAQAPSSSDLRLLDTGPTPPTSDETARGHQPAPAVPRLVFALYYPWYSLKSVSGQDRHVDVDPSTQHIRDFAHTPAAGLHDSSDPKTISRQLADLKSAGVDVILCSWWGASDYTAANTKRVMSQAAAAGLKVCVLIEQLERVKQKGDTLDAVAELTDLAGSIGADPDYLKIGGKPVVFIYDRARDQLGNSGWATVLLALEKSAAPGILAVGDSEDGPNGADSLVYDGLHFNNPAAWLAQEFHAWPRALMSHAVRLHFQKKLETEAVADARSNGRLFVATVSPGFDDRELGSQGRGLYAARTGGELYQDSWQAALASRPDWVLVQSYNEWHDGTEIEPSKEFGSQYLKLTAQYAAKFKGGAAFQSFQPGGQRAAMSQR